MADNRRLNPSEEEHLAQKTTLLNINATEFRPNVAAKEFVPSWLKKDPAPTPPIIPQEEVVVKPKENVIIPPTGNVEEEEENFEEVTTNEQNDQINQAIETDPVVDDPVDEVYSDDDDDDQVKEHMNILFIGHVDAGKSTLGGQILYLTGMVDKRTLEKFEREAREQNRESWFLSWALDTSASERAKGITVDVGKAYFETDKKRFTIIDAPGHKSYVPNMIGGAAQADVGILVISARKGEFETGFERGGQTREHAILAKTAGVKRLIVVVNKMDDPTVNWSQERYDEIVGKLGPFLRQSGYNPKTELDFMPLSGFTGANVKEPMKSGVCDWYKGKPFLTFLDDLPMVERKVNEPFLLPITDKLKEMGVLFVGGKVEYGRVRKGQKVLVMPIKKRAIVTGILSEEEEIEKARSGDNIKLKLSGVDEKDISEGFVLCSPKRPVHSAVAFEAQLVIMELKGIMCPGFSAVMHLHTATEEITIGALLHLVDKKTQKKSKKPPMFVKQGQAVIARIETSLPLCVEVYKDFPQLGRFTLRCETTTIAIGKVTKILE